MNPEITEIAYILDRSGSMEPMREPAVAAFNDFLKSQLDVPGDARLTLVQFDNAYEVPIAARPLHEVEPLAAADYVPRGSTALLDAIGRTIKETDRRIQSLPPDQQPGKVIFAVFTDGEENASREFTHRHLADLIQIYQDQKGWAFLFLAANQDAIATAAGMNIDASLGGNVEFHAKGIRSSGQAMSRKVRSMRLKNTNQMDVQAFEDERKSLDEIVREEEERF